MPKRAPRKVNVKRPGRSTRRKPVTSAKKSSFGSRVKGRVSSIFVWALVVVNLVLIASLVHRFVRHMEGDREIAIVSIDDPKLEVLNGTDVNGLAKSFSDYLRSKGFDVVKVDNAESADYQTSMVIDLQSARPRKNSPAAQVAEALGIDESKVFAMKDDESQTDVRVILGADHTSLKAFEKLNR